MPEKAFTLFHLSLVPIQQLDIEMRTGETRESWLRFALSEGFEFSHRAGGTLYWVPQGDADECILGIIQRTRSHSLHKPPREGGGEMVSDEWQGAYVLLDPTHHDEGQRVAVENDVVGMPRALIKSLADSLNRRPDAPFQIELEFLFDASRFWAFAQRHDNIMRRIAFEFVVPNMWGTESDLEKDLNETGRTTGAERVGVTFAGDHGVSTENDKVRNGVEYAEKGAGTVRALAQDGARFSSTKQPRVTRIPAIQAGADAVRGYFAGLKRRILGREQDAAVDDTDSDGGGPAVG